MKEADSFLTEDDANIGDMSALETHLEQSNVSFFFIILYILYHYSVLSNFKCILD